MNDAMRSDLLLELADDELSRAKCDARTRRILRGEKPA